MNAFEQLLRKKLTAKLTEEKQRIAEALLTEMTVTPAMKKQKKQAQIAVVQGKITLMQGKVSTAKDPAAMKEKLETLKQKLKLYQDEMTQIH